MQIIIKTINVIIVKKTNKSSIGSNWMIRYSKKKNNIMLQMKKKWLMTL